MVEVGKYNTMEVARQVDFGIYLRRGEVEVLMPQKWVPQGTKPGDEMDVFVFRDSDDRLIATTVEPFVTANTFGFLEVRDVNSFGAFLDWGMEKDLLVPFSEQAYRMEPGRSYVVFAYLDAKTDRMVASTKLNKFFDKEEVELMAADIVDLLVYSETDLGFNAIINNRYSGLLYKNELFESIRIGDAVKGYVKQIRPDGKIDLSLQKSGYELVDEVRWKIVQELKANGNFLPLNDDSTPETIKARLQISKKAFKKAVGALYKERLIQLEKDGIRLLKSN